MTKKVKILSTFAVIALIMCFLPPFRAESQPVEIIGSIPQNIERVGEIAYSLWTLVIFPIALFIYKIYKSNEAKVEAQERREEALNNRVMLIEERMKHNEDKSLSRAEAISSNLNTQRDLLNRIIDRVDRINERRTQ